MTNTSTLNSVEHACAELLRNGQAATFTAVAAHTGLGRTTLYRDSMIRGVIEENRHRAAASGTLTGLTARSPPSAPHSTPSPRACGATKNNSGN